MARRERLMSWAFWLLVGGLLLGTSAGRATLAAPVNLGVVAPRWAVWSGALFGYFAALLLPWRAVRVLIGCAVMHAFVPVPFSNPLPWSLVQEAGVFALVVLCDLAFLPIDASGPPRPRHTPAAALREVVYSVTTAVHERRRVRRAQ